MAELVRDYAPVECPRVLAQELRGVLQHLSIDQRRISTVLTILPRRPLSKRMQRLRLDLLELEWRLGEAERLLRDALAELVAR